MRFLFYLPAKAKYDSNSVRQLPCGGTEKAVTFLAEALERRGHSVLVICDGETEFSWQDVDVFVTQEGQHFFNCTNVQRVYWSHHFTDQPIAARSAAFVRIYADHVVTLSQCHHDDWQNNFRIPSTIIPHGINFDELAAGDKQPNRFIYASTPFRGLSEIPELWPKIKALLPDATLAVCSSMATYGTPEEDAHYAELFERVGRLEDVEMFGSLNQHDLYRQYARADVFLYPSIWPETYCLAMDEAIAHGCVPLTSGLGALSERSTGRIDEFIQAGPAYLDGVGTRSPISWDEVARQWEEMICTPKQ